MLGKSLYSTTCLQADLDCQQVKLASGEPLRVLVSVGVESFEKMKGSTMKLEKAYPLA